MHQGVLSHLSPVLKLIILLLIVVFFGSISSAIVGIVGHSFFSIDLTSIDAIQKDVAFMRVFQIIQSISLFILPSLIGFFLFYKNYAKGINGENTLDVRSIIITIALVIIGQGFITYSGWLNHQLELPTSFQYVLDWMLAKEEEVGQITTLMLQHENWQQVLMIVVMLSILPALGEEWLFRGFIQRELGRAFNNAHLAIFITAILFSAIHMQFLTFLPRFFLGVILGYLFLYSRNLWLAVLAHFTNNFMAVVIYIIMINRGEGSPLDMPTENPFGFGVVFSLSTIIIFLYVIKRIYDSKEPMTR